MIRKTCPVCGGESYSASTCSTWMCPYCNTDLTDEPAKNATERTEQDRIHS